jgi:hypothetical protein
MNVEHASTWPCPSVEHYEVEANGAIGEPAVFIVREPIETMGRKEVPELVIVSGPLSSPRAQEQALRIAQEQKRQALLVAVCKFESSTSAPSDEDLLRLCAAYHAVLAVTDTRCEQLIDRLIRTIVTLDGQEQWLACDWNDIRHIVGSSETGLVRHGSGCHSGPDRAAAAASDAITQIERNGPRLHTAQGMCIGIQSSSKELYGGEIKAVLSQVSAASANGVTITLSVGRSLTIEPSALEVNMFAFGERRPAQLANSGGDDGAVKAIDAAAFAWTGENAALDPLYPHARSLVLSQQRASISLIQRHLRIGYGRASRLLEAMEGDAVSAQDDHGLRKVLVPDSAT